MASRARRRRLRLKSKKSKISKISKILPTPERLAKGDISRLESGQMKSQYTTFLDVMVQEDVYYEHPDSEKIYLSLAFMMDLTERSGLFASATRKISALSFVDGRSDADISAADEWRQILKSLSNSARKTTVGLLSDMRPRPASSFHYIIDDVRELSRNVEKFRFQNIY